MATSASEPAAQENAAGHWAYQPLKSHPAPRVKDTAWPRSSIDRFILARLESEGLAPTVDADRFTLLRRLSFDLTGLPPTPSQLADFARDRSSDAWPRRVELMLASPRFGEHWARHWMDVVRYAESVTLRGFVFPEAWRYRDYLIEAFNRDVSYDRMILEQIAGDLLPAEDWRQASRQLVATSFLALGNTNLEEQDKKQLEMDVVDEQLDTIGKAFLGQTIGCARCHDHKHDPIPTRDYYALAGIFKSVRSLKHANVSEWIERPLPLDPGFEAEVAAGEREQRELKETLDCHRLALQASTGPSRASLASELKLLETAHQQLEARRPQRPRAMSVVEQTAAIDLPIHRRGSVHSLGEVVPRGFLERIHGPNTRPPRSQQSGRKELAAWIADASNPLTARVFVNRVWYWLLGEGLVRTLDNFGTTGDAPSHPDLLDTLASRFIAENWSVKQLVRSIVMSRVYQLAANRGADRDIDNRWLAHANRRRLQAEQIRDAMLSISGELRLDGGGRTFSRDLSADYGFIDQGTRRSVYVPVFRNALPELFECFDFPPPLMGAGRREASVVPSQALFLLNHPFVRERAMRAAQRVAEGSVKDDALRLQSCYQSVLGRNPTDQESRLLLEHVRASADSVAAWTEVLHALFASVDFRYLY